MPFEIFFTEYLLNHKLITLIFLFVYLFIYFMIYKKAIRNIFDCLVIEVVYQSFCSTVVTLMYYLEILELKYFIIYWIGDICYLVGFRIPFFLKVERKTAKNIQIDIRNIDFLFYLISIIFILSQLYSFFKIGIPILSSKPRTSLYTDSNGLLYYLVMTSQFMTAILVVLKINRKEKKGIYKKIVLIFLIFSYLTNGSKFSLLIIIFILSNYLFYFRGTSLNLNEEKKIYKKLTVFFIISVISLIPIIIISEKKNLLLSLLQILYRFFAAGDIYVNGLNSTMLENITVNSRISYLTPGLLVSLLNKIGLDIPVNQGIGFQINNILYNINNSFTGPNGRQNYLFYLFFKEYGFIFSFFLGLLVGSIRHLFLGLFKISEMGFFIYTILLLSTYAFQTDITIGLNLLFSTLMLLLLIKGYFYPLKKVLERKGNI